MLCFSCCAVNYCWCVAVAGTELIESLLHVEDALVMPILIDSLNVEVGINLLKIMEVVCTQELFLPFRDIRGDPAN